MSIFCSSGLQNFCRFLQTLLISFIFSSSSDIQQLYSNIIIPFHNKLQLYIMSYNHLFKSDLLQCIIKVVFQLNTHYFLFLYQNFMNKIRYKLLKKPMNSYYSHQSAVPFALLSLLFLGNICYHALSPFIPVFTYTLILSYISQIIQTNQMDEQDRLHSKGKPKHIILPQTDQDMGDVPLYGKCMNCWGQCCGCMRTWAPCICCCFIDYPYQIIPQGFEGVYQKFGRYLRTVKPGLHYINPCTQTLEKVNMKICVMDLQRQNIITKDNVSINIDAAVYYKIQNARYAHYRVQNINLAIAEVTYAILKNTCGQFILQDLLEKRQEISDDIQKQVDEYVEEWGTDIEEIFIKDIQLSRDLQASLSSAAKERRLAQSKIISAKADVQAAKLMRLAAEELNSKSAMQIRYLQTLKQVGKSNTRVIYIPQMKNKERIQHLITQGLIS